MPWGPEWWALANPIPAAADVCVPSSPPKLPVPPFSRVTESIMCQCPPWSISLCFPGGPGWVCTIRTQRTHESTDRHLSHYLCSCKGWLLAEETGQRPEQGLLSLEQLQLVRVGTHRSFPSVSAPLERYSSFKKHLSILKILWDPYTEGTREKIYS